MSAAAAPSYPDNAGWQGQAGPFDLAAELNSHAFLIRQMMNGLATAEPVIVVAVTAPGGVAKAGTVSVRPLVNQIDGSGNATPHGIIYGLPYLRIQGGANAVIMDPVAGDIGVAIFAARDMSVVKATGKQANPGSRRRHDWADGTYIGGLLNGVPLQYILFGADGITMLSPTKITLQAPEIDTVGLLKNNGINVGSTHIHTDPQGGNTGPPF